MSWHLHKIIWHGWWLKGDFSLDVPEKCLFNFIFFLLLFVLKNRRQERCQVTKKQNADSKMKTWHEIWMNTFERQCFEWAMYNYTCVMSRFRIIMKSCKKISCGVDWLSKASDVWQNDGMNRFESVQFNFSVIEHFINVSNNFKSVYNCFWTYWNGLQFCSIFKIFNPAAKFTSLRKQKFNVWVN